MSFVEIAGDVFNSLSDDLTKMLREEPTADCCSFHHELILGGMPPQDILCKVLAATHGDAPPLFPLPLTPPPPVPSGVSGRVRHRYRRAVELNHISN